MVYSCVIVAMAFLEYTGVTSLPVYWIGVLCGISLEDLQPFRGQEFAQAIWWGLHYHFKI